MLFIAYPPEFLSVVTLAITVMFESMYSLILVRAGSHDMPMTAHVSALPADSSDDGWWAACVYYMYVCAAY